MRMSHVFAVPSRDDAWDITRNEKIALMFLMNATSAIQDSVSDLKKRLEKIDGGEQMMKDLAELSVNLLTEIRRTIPENQRVSLNNVSKDMEMRLVPKATPSKTTVVVQKEDFRSLVDAAQVKCRECTDSNEESRECGLCKLLKVVVPLENYGSTFLCPYNMAGWEN